MEVSKFPDSFGKYMHPQLAVLLAGGEYVANRHLCLLRQSLMSSET